MNPDTIIQRLPETIIEGKRLGAHFQKDPRSKNHHVRPHISGYQTDPTKLSSRVWKREVPVFDQGNVGSCTGNACAGMLASDPLYSVDAVGQIGEPFALALYEKATQVDGMGAAYPPNDRGSSTLGVLKAAKDLGYISSYKWGFGLVDMLNMIALVGPVITGVSWYEGFDSPLPSGELKISGSVRGGHELELAEIDVPNKLVWGWNSWGDWDQHGRFAWAWDTIGELLNSGGEVGIGMKGTV